MKFLYLNSDKMGDGDPQLGRKLMKSFLTELATSNIHIDAIGCVNSAINLTTEGSDVIDIFKTFASRGVRIATCGTCLEHYGRKDALLIGEVGSMDMTVKIMASAEQIIRPN